MHSICSHQDDFFIQWIWIFDKSTNGCNGEYDLVFLSVDSRDNDLVDDQKIVLPEDKCFLAIGRFFYESKVGRKVVRKVKIENAYTDGDLNKIN